MPINSSASDVVELFGFSTCEVADWPTIVSQRACRFENKPCYKTRKSDSSTAIGTCTVRIGKDGLPLIICPKRLLEGGKVFADCIHLLSRHQPGNQLHLVSEVSIPGGSVDYFLVSEYKGRPIDFVGVEFQTMDTTGTVWPARQKFLRSVGMVAPVPSADAGKSYGVNWKMTAKTILVQLHHKAETFEAIGRNLVLVVQVPFMDYMSREFNFGHLTNPSVPNDAMHFHAYDAVESGTGMSLEFHSRLSTSSAGISQALNLNVTRIVEEATIFKALAAKMSNHTKWSPVSSQVA